MSASAWVLALELVSAWVLALELVSVWVLALVSVESLNHLRMKTSLPRGKPPFALSMGPHWKGARWRCRNRLLSALDLRRCRRRESVTAASIRCRGRS